MDNNVNVSKMTNTQGMQNMNNMGNMGGQPVSQAAQTAQSGHTNVLDKSDRQINNGIQWIGAMAPHAVVGTRQNIEVIAEYDYSKYGMRVEVLEYQKLQGNTNVFAAQNLYFMSEANIKCRQIAIYMMNSGCKIESGAMSYMQGPLQMTTGINSVNKFVGQMFTGKLTGEKMIMPEYQGSGILVLEPSFKHFFVGELEAGEQIVVDKGMFYAASPSVQIEPCFAGGLSGSLLGGEGIFQQQITGPGMIILELPVPMCEINICDLNNDVLKVDGNFAVLRSGNIQMNVERSSQTLVGSAMSGEGLLNVFRGTGQVWLAPTIKVYDAVRLSRQTGGDISNVDMNTSTGRAALK